MHKNWDIQGHLCDGSACSKCMLSCVRLFVTPQTVACLASFSREFCRQEYWSGLPLLGSSQPRDRTYIFFIGRWVLYSWATLEPGSTFRDVDKFPSFPVYHEGNSEKKNLYIAWEVSTKVILYSMTVFCRKYSPHWLLHHLLYPPPFCRHFLSKIPPPCHGFKICSGEECSKDKRFSCKERVPLLQVITFMV